MVSPAMASPRRYLAAFVGAGCGAVVGGLVGALVGSAIAVLSGMGGFESLGFFLIGQLMGVPLGACVGYWNALALAGRRPHVTSVGLLAGLTVAASAGAYWLAALPRLPLWQVAALAALVPGLCALLAYGVDKRL